MRRAASILLVLCATWGAVRGGEKGARAAEPAVDLSRGLVGQWPKIERPIDVPADKAPRLGTGDFTWSLWARSDEVADRQPGDLLSQYDAKRRRGFHLTLKSNPGATTNQANWRHLQFGVDDDRTGEWRDCGRPGKALLAFALAVHEGVLYAGTCEPGKDESGRVYRYDGDDRWVDCGAPDKSNSVTSLAVYHGKLYAGTGKYRLAGSALVESENVTLGGRIFRYDGDSRWTDCGQLPQTEAVGGLVVFRDRLYASSLYKPAGFFRYEDETRWTSLPTPEGLDRATSTTVPKRVEALTVFEGYLYASSYDGGNVHRFDGQKWIDCGQLGDNTQTYSFAQYEGRLYVGTWPSGRVYRFEDVAKWTDVGRLGEEREVMGMLVHNGRLIAGTLPLAEVYSYEGGEQWKRLARLDHTPDVTYRRAWTMAEHDGQVFCSTLPSGKIFKFSAGRQAQYGRSLSSDWHHVAAMRAGGELRLFVDGRLVAENKAGGGESYPLNTDAPLRIGAGKNGGWTGSLSDVRAYDRALSSDEIQTLAKQRPER